MPPQVDPSFSVTPLQYTNMHPQRYHFWSGPPPLQNDMMFTPAYMPPLQSLDYGESNLPVSLDKSNMANMAHHEPDNDLFQYHSQKSMERSISEEEKESLHKHMTRKAAVKITPYIKDWKRLGSSLLLDDVDISHIFEDYSADGVEEVIIKVMLRWMKTNDSAPTFMKFREALINANESAAEAYLLGNLADLAQDK